MSLSQRKRLTQTSFFLLFLFAPILDVFRLDLTQGHFILFSHAWTLGIDTAIERSESIALTVLLHVFLPVISVLIVILLVIWKWGRLYCGWLCPHFSVVESINQLMFRWLNRVTLWEPATQPVRTFTPWIIVTSFTLFMAFIWAFSLLSYLLPPKELIVDLYHLQLGSGSVKFLSVATIIFSIDFMFFRHWFCRYGCAVGIFQSILWMANPKAMRVIFDKSLASQCKHCDNLCDLNCPMRLRPRGSKRSKFNCTQCGVCLTTCAEVSSSQKGIKLNQSKNQSVIKW